MSSLKQKDIIGRIITLQSLKFNGHYVHCHSEKEFNLQECDYTELPNAVWTRLLVHNGHDNTIVLESIRFRNHYVFVTGHPDKHGASVELKHAPNPPTDDSEWHRNTHWRLLHIAENRYALKSAAFPDTPYSNIYLQAHCSKGLQVTPLPGGVDRMDGRSRTPEWEWMVSIGPVCPGVDLEDAIKDGYETVASLKNVLDHPTILNYKRTQGITVQMGSSTNYTYELGNETHVNFSAGPVDGGTQISINYSSEWSTSSIDGNMV